MASTGILQRRDIKANLLANPPIDGEIVYATDTDEHGFVNGGVLYWKKMDMLQPIKTVTSPPTGLENDPIGTVYLLVNSIISIAITPTNGNIDTNTPAPSVQYTATATYGDGTTSDVTNSVNWLSDNNLVTVSTTGLAEYTGASNYTGVANITSELNGVVGTTILNLSFSS